MTLGDLLGLKKIRCGGPLDFAQWQLSSQARGLRMIVDEHGDLVAFPVVIVDPTADKVAATGVEGGTPWRASQTLSAPGVATLHAPADPAESSYLLGMIIDYSDSALAVPGLMGITFAAIAPPGPVLLNHEFWVAAAAAFRPSLVLSFGAQGLRAIGGIQVGTGTALTTGVVRIQAWGFDR